MCDQKSPKEGGTSFGDEREYGSRCYAHQWQGHRTAICPGCYPPKPKVVAEGTNPTRAAPNEEDQRDLIRMTRNAKGLSWTITVTRDPGEPLDKWARRVQAVHQELTSRLGNEPGYEPPKEK